MYLFNHMRELYETASPGSTEYILAQYILLNIRKTNQLTIASISENTAISKSAVSKFIKKISFDYSFSQFKSSLEFEMQYNILDYQTIIRDAKASQNLTFSIHHQEHHFSDFIQTEDIEKLASILKEKKKFIFCGDNSKKGFFHQLINFLLYDEKDAKYVSWIYSNHQTEDLTSLDESSVLIIVEPNSSIYDFFLRQNLSVDISSDLNKKVKAEKIYIGRPSKNTSLFQIIGIESTHYIAIDDMVLSYFTSQLLMNYLQLTKKWLK